MPRRAFPKVLGLVAPSCENVGAVGLPLCPYLRGVSAVSRTHGTILVFTAHLNDTSLAYSKSFLRFHQQKPIKKRSIIPRRDARTIVKARKRGLGATEESDSEEDGPWAVLDPLGLGSMVGEVAGETVDEKAPGSGAVDDTVDLQALD